MITLFYVVSYDISDNKRRTRLSKYLQSYGVRVQYSVFEMELSKEQYGILKKGVRKLIEKGEDSIRIYSICAECRKKIETIGKDKGHYYDDEFVII